MIPQQPNKEEKPITYRPVPFNFVDLEEKANGYLARVKSEAVQIAAQARNEVAKLRETTLSEIREARSRAQEETEQARNELNELQQRLLQEEESYQARKTHLESEIIKQKAALKQNEESALKKGYDEGYQTGYNEGKSKGYADGELQATIDYADKVRNEAAVQLGAELETLLPALRDMIGQIETAKQSFLRLWETSAINVATAIAQRAISRQLPEMVDVPLKLLREALELGAGSTSVKVRLNPENYEALQPQMDIILNEMSGAVQTELIPDAKITHGGCILETSLGLIDNTIEARLDRIEQELIMVGE